MLNFFNNALYLLTFMALAYSLFLLYQVTQPLPAIDVMAHQRINQLSLRTDAQHTQLRDELNIRLIRLEGPVYSRQSQPKMR